MNITQAKAIVKKEFNEEVCKEYGTHFAALAKETRFSLTRRQGYGRIAKAFKKTKYAGKASYPTLRAVLNQLYIEVSQARQVAEDIALPGPTLESIEEQFVLAAQAEATARFLQITYRERQK